MDKIEMLNGINTNCKLPKSVKAIIKCKNKKKPIDYSHPAFQYTTIRNPENFVTNKKFWKTTGKIVGYSFFVPFAMFCGICLIFGQDSE